MYIASILFAFSTLFCSEETSLMQAIKTGAPAAQIQEMIASGEDVNAVFSEFLRAVNPVLRYALDRGTDPESVTIICMLINAGADVNALTYNRVDDERLFGMMTLGRYAAIYSSREVIDLFVGANADLHPPAELCAQ